MKEQLFLLICIILTGCNGKTITENKIYKNVYEENTINENLIPSISNDKTDKHTSTVDKNRILNTLQLLSSTPRPFDSDGEKRTINYLNNELISYGYTTEHQRFPVYRNKSTDLSLALRIDDKATILGYGTNLIGTLMSKNNTNEQLIISAHHDTIKDSVGVIDNATGVSIVLEIARLLQEYHSPFNIKFIFFGAEEEGCIGSREYLGKLSDSEKDQIIGCINIDMVGEKFGKVLSVGTRYSRANALSILLNEYLGDDGVKPSLYGLSDDYFMFKNSIPAISINNKTDPSLERLSYEEQMENLDIQMLVDAVQTVTGFIMNFDLQNYMQIKIQDTILNVSQDNNINLNNSHFNIRDAKIPNYSIKDIRVKLIQKGSSSETVVEYINNNGDKYCITQAPNEYFNQENLNTMELIDSDENIALYINKNKDSDLKAIYKETYGFYYGKVIGNLTENEILYIFK